MYRSCSACAFVTRPCIVICPMAAAGEKRKAEEKLVVSACLPASQQQLSHSLCVFLSLAPAAAGEKRKAEEKLVVSAAAGVPTHLDKLDLGAHRDPQLLRAQFKVGGG